MSIYIDYCYYFLPNALQLKTFFNSLNTHFEALIFCNTLNQFLLKFLVNISQRNLIFCVVISNGNITTKLSFNEEN